MLEEKILNDYKEAMKSKDAVKSSVLSLLRSDFKYAAINKKKNSLDDNDIIPIIKKHIKQHQDSIEQFTKGNRQDLADKEAKELAVLKAYLPEELPIEEVRRIIEEAVMATGAQGIKDMGKVMKEVTAKIAGKADSKVVSDLVRERLNRQ